MITSKVHRRFVLYPALVLWLAAVWVLLWSDLTLANVLAGLVVGVVVTSVLPLQPVPFALRIHPVGLVVLLGRLAVDIVVASVQVAAIAVRRRPPRSAVLRIRLRSHSDVVLTLTAELVSVVPGSIVVEAHRLTGTLYVHVLDVDMAGGIESARRHVLAQEERVLRALAARAELEEAGIAAPAREGAP